MIILKRRIIGMSLFFWRATIIHDGKLAAMEKVDDSISLSELVRDGRIVEANKSSDNHWYQYWDVKIKSSVLSTEYPNCR